MYVPTIKMVLITANLMSLISKARPAMATLWTRRGRHFRTLSTLPLQGCSCSGYENMTRITMAAQPTVDASVLEYCAMMLPPMWSPNER